MLSFDFDLYVYMYTHIHEHTQRQGVIIYNQRDIQSIWFSGPKAQTSNTGIQLNINHRVEEKSLRGDQRNSWVWSALSSSSLGLRVEMEGLKTRQEQIAAPSPPPPQQFQILPAPFNPVSFPPGCLAFPSISILLFCSVVFDSVSLCRAICPGSHYVD